MKVTIYHNMTIILVLCKYLLQHYKIHIYKLTLFCEGASIINSYDTGVSPWHIWTTAYEKKGKRENNIWKDSALENICYKPLDRMRHLICWLPPVAFTSKWRLRNTLLPPKNTRMCTHTHKNALYRAQRALLKGNFIRYEKQFLFWFSSIAFGGRWNGKSLMTR